MFRFVDLNPSQHDPEAQEGSSVRGEMGSTQPPDGLFGGLGSVSRPGSLSLQGLRLVSWVLRPG